MSGEFQQLVAIGAKVGVFAGVVVGILASLWTRAVDNRTAPTDDTIAHS